ncbi:MAG TPA: phosphopantetheine-binding protein [Acidimicrobiales bacterium]|nr:phosphopantetheine-binding protein [Acidimicrobiales bacterium]
MTRDEIRAAVLAALGDVAPEADLAALASDAELREVLDLDSMDFLGVVQRIAAATGVEVSEADYARLATLGGCVEYLAARTGE